MFECFFMKKKNDAVTTKKNLLNVFVLNDLCDSSPSGNDQVMGDLARM